MNPAPPLPVSFRPDGDTFSLTLDEETARRLGVADGGTYGVEAGDGEIHLRRVERPAPPAPEPQRPA